MNLELILEFLFIILTLIKRLRVSALILLETAETTPSYIFFLLPENLALIGKPFFITGAKTSGIFKSEKITELSSSVIMIELLESRISPVIPLYPNTPLNGAMILVSFRVYYNFTFFNIILKI